MIIKVAKKKEKKNKLKWKQKFSIEVLIEKIIMITEL